MLGEILAELPLEPGTTAAVAARAERTEEERLMDISLIYELETNDTSEAGIRRCYAECLEQVKPADALGYRAVWFTEHHFLPGFSYSSAPEVFLA